MYRGLWVGQTKWVRDLWASGSRGDHGLFGLVKVLEPFEFGHVYFTRQ